MPTMRGPSRSPWLKWPRKRPGEGYDQGTPDVIFRAPLYTSRPTGRTPLVELTQNLLLATLAVVAAMPFRGGDGPSAPRAVTPQVQVAPNLLTSTLAPGLPFGAQDGPSAPRARLFPQSEGPNLLTSTLAPVQQAAFRGAIKTVFQAARSPYVEDPENLLTSTLAPVAMPFRQNDWPRTERLNVRRSFEPQNLLLTTLAPVAAPPFRGVEGPRAPSARLYQQYDAPNLLTATLAPVQQATFRGNISTAWDPHRAPYVEDPENLLTGTLAPAAAGAPFRYADWPSAPRARFYQGSDAPNLLVFRTPAAAPFRHTEWQPAPSGLFNQPSDAPNLLTSTLAPVQQAARIERSAPYTVRPQRVTWSAEQPSRPLVKLGPAAPVVIDDEVTPGPIQQPYTLRLKRPSARQALRAKAPQASVTREPRKLRRYKAEIRVLTQRTDALARAIAKAEQERDSAALAEAMRLAEALQVELEEYLERRRMMQVIAITLLLLEDA